LSPRAAEHHREGGDHAPRRLPLRSGARIESGRALRGRRDLRAAPPPLRGEQRLPGGAHREGDGDLGPLARQAAGRNDRAPWAPLLRGLPVPPRIQVAPAGAAPPVPVVRGGRPACPSGGPPPPL